MINNIIAGTSSLGSIAASRRRRGRPGHGCTSPADVHTCTSVTDHRFELSDKMELETPSESISSDLAASGRWRVAHTPLCQTWYCQRQERVIRSRGNDFSWQ